MSNDTRNAVRSPSYPGMSLRRAVEEIAKIDGPYRTAPVDRQDAAKLIGFSGLSGPASKALADLAAYGLVERAGKGQLRVTSRAQAILHPNSVSERRDYLRQAAREPRLFRQVHDHFGGVVPPEDGIATYLSRQGFNKNAIRPAAKAFLQTAEFLEGLGATGSHDSLSSSEPVSDASNGGDVPTFGGAKVGDLVQWESQGALQLPEPLRVRAVSEDGQWVAVEGSETGIPMSQVIVESAAQSQTGMQAPKFPISATEPQKAADGEVEWMRNRVGQNTNVRLLVKGDMGPKEIGKLIKLLEAQKLVLEEE